MTTRLCLSFLPGLLVASLAAHPGHNLDVPPWQDATAWPDRVIATIDDDPTTSFAVSWRTDMSVAPAVAQIAPATAEARFDVNAATVNGETVSVPLDHIDYEGEVIPILQNAGLPPVHYHSVSFRGLQPDTLYAYRVRGAPGKWSPWRQLRTAPAAGPLQFLFFGDAQNGIRSHVTRVFDTAAEVAPRARFAIHGGDLVNTAMYDQEWAQWFESLGRTHLTRPALPVAGNHDYFNYAKVLDEGLEDTKLFMMTQKGVTPLWRPQFALPAVNGLPKDLQETVYSVRYGHDLEVFVLDSSGIAFDEQMAWLERQLAASDAPWHVLTMHHPLFSFVGGVEHPSAEARRLALLSVLENHDVDLILTGHRHTYQRGGYGLDVARFGVGEPHAVKTMFVVTASTVKRGATKKEGWERYSEQTAGSWKLDRMGDNASIFAVIDIDGDTLRYRAYDAVGELYDGFTLSKDAGGEKTVVSDPVAETPERTFENSGPFIPWHDLR